MPVAKALIVPPALLLTVTVLYGGYLNTITFFASGKTIPGILTVAMLALVIVVIVDSFVQWSKLLSGPAKQPRPVFGADIVAEAA